MANRHLLIRTGNERGGYDYYFIPKDCIGPPVQLPDGDGEIEKKIQQLKADGKTQNIDFAIWITEEEKVDNVIRGRN